MIKQAKFLLVSILLLLSSFSLFDQKIFKKFSDTRFELEFLENKKYCFSVYNYQVKSYERAFGTFKHSKTKSMILEIESLSEDLYDSTYIIVERNDKIDTVLTMQKVDPFFTLKDFLSLTFVNDSILKVKYKMDTMTLYSHSKGYYEGELGEYK